MSDDEDFKRQLELEEIEKQRKEAAEHGEADPYTYTDPNDGTVYEWDHDKKAWFPKITEDFLAAYHASYGVNYDASTANSSSAPEPSKDEGPSRVQDELASEANVNGTLMHADGRIVGQRRKDKQKKQEAKWFEVDDAHNTKVYVSNLPSDTNEEEFVETMSKCGMIMKDEKGQLKIKLYRNPDGSLKGDALCCYIKIESVDLALNILDGYQMRPKHAIRVERAKFQLKGEYDPSKKPRKKKKDKEKFKKKIEKLFDWRPDRMRGERMRFEATVVIKNMFSPQDFDKDPTLILEYQRDLREECAKFGEVKKVVVYDRHLEGIATIAFKEVEHADACIAVMNNRFFAGRRLLAANWDGREKFKVTETDEQLEERLKKWDEYLEDGEETTKPENRTETADVSGQSNISIPKQAADNDSLVMSEDKTGVAVTKPEVQQEPTSGDSKNAPIEERELGPASPKRARMGSPSEAYNPNDDASTDDEKYFEDSD